jgi:hypothetical protein
MAQSVQQLGTGWTVQGSNLGGGEVFRTNPHRPWANPTSCTMLVFFPGDKAAGRGVDHPPTSSAEVKDKPRAVRQLHVWVFVAYYKFHFNFLPYLCH